MKRLTLLIGLSFFICACSLYQIESDGIVYKHHPTKTSDMDVAYMETVSQPYEVIGKATVNSERIQKKENVIAKLKHEAAMLGGDAITNLTTNAGTGKWAMMKPKNLFGNANIRINYMADVIIFNKPVPVPVSEASFKTTTQEPNLK